MNKIINNKRKNEWMNEKFSIGDKVVGLEISKIENIYK